MLYRKNHLPRILVLCFLTSFSASYAAEAPAEKQLPPPEKYADCINAAKYVKRDKNNYVFEYVFEPWITINKNTSPKKAERFSTKTWMEKDVGHIPDPKTRHMMLPDLFSCYSLIGMTREDVHNLLGPPDDRKLKEIGSNIDSYLVTSGPCSLSPKCWMEILYKNQTVTAYRILHITRELVSNTQVPL